MSGANAAAKRNWPPEPALDEAQAQFAADVAYYLTLEPRQLPSRYLYDGLGSALFDAICRLPWYRVTAGEARLLGAHGAEILRRVAPAPTIIELGPGNGEKLRCLLDARLRPTEGHDVHLVDVSSDALETAARTIASSEGVRVWCHQAQYEAGLGEATRHLVRGTRALVLFLGSNIGNFDPPGSEAFLRLVRAQLRAGDALLLGTDLVKPERDLLAAYDDPLGVTAAFNRNLLVRINRELDGDLDLDGFAHRAVWDAEASRVEMHLVSRRAQQAHIRLARVSLTLSEGDTIWTESSYKYQPGQVVEMLRTAGFERAGLWIDAESRFALTLAHAV